MRRRVVRLRINRDDQSFGMRATIYPSHQMIVIGTTTMVGRRSRVRSKDEKTQGRIN